MTIWDQLDEIHADPALSDEDKRRARYHAKAWAIADILNNGKPAPNPIPRIVGQTYRLDGVDYTLHFAAQEEREGIPVLRIVLSGRRVSDGVLLISPNNDYIFVNPPTMTKTQTKDLAQAAREMLAARQSATGKVQAADHLS